MVSGHLPSVLISNSKYVVHDHIRTCCLWHLIHNHEWGFLLCHAHYLRGALDSYKEETLTMTNDHIGDFLWRLKFDWSRTKVSMIDSALEWGWAVRTWISFRSHSDDTGNTRFTTLWRVVRIWAHGLHAKLGKKGYWIFLIYVIKVVIWDRRWRNAIWRCKEHSPD